MERTTERQVDSGSNFSFGTASNWRGFDATTMRIHSRARVLQSQQRSRRFRREATDCLLLEATQIQDDIEEKLARLTAKPPTVITLHDAQHQTEIAARRERQALIDLRRTHEVNRRRLVTILRDTQPLTAATNGRWG